MTCVRSMLLTQKKVTVTQRTLEGALSFDATATEDKVSISSRCADLDAMMPAQMGVSKAVLENVIFCHQEESNWPLSEPSILKKKFDEIFAATRYTKALDSIKSICKDRRSNLLVSQVELKNVEAKKIKSASVRSDYEKSTADIHEYRTRIQSIHEQEKEVTGQIEALAEQIQEFMSLRSKIEGLEMGLEQKVSTYKEIAASTGVLEISDHELSEMRAEIERSIESRGSDVKKQRDECDELSHTAYRLQKQIDETVAEIGVLKAAQNSMEEKITNRAAVIAELCAQHGFVVDVTVDADDQASECKIMIEDSLSSAEHESAKVQRDGEAKERELQQDIQRVQAEMQSHTNTVTLCEQHIASSQAEIKSLKHRQASLQVDEAHTKMLQQEIDDEKEKLAAAEAIDYKKEYEEKARQSRFQVAGIHEEVARIQGEIQRNNMQADTRAKLDIKRKELEVKESRWHVLKDDKDLVGFANSSQIVNDEAKRTSMIESRIAQQKSDLANCDEKLKTAQKELGNTQTRLGLAKSSVAKQTKEMAAKSERIRSVCGDKPFDEVYAETQSEMHELVEEAGHYKSASSMFETYIHKIESDHMCPVCHRGWENKSDETKLVSKLKLDYASAPTELLKVETEMKGCERRIEELSGLQSIVRDVKLWNTEERAELESQIKSLAESESELIERCDNIEMERVSLDSEIEYMVSVKAKSEDLAELSGSRKVLLEEIEGLERELRVTGSTKTVSELQQEISGLQTQERNARAEQERLNQEFMLKQQEIGIQQGKIRQLQDKLSETDRQIMELQSIGKRIAELEAGIIENQRKAKEARK
ncbi:DNA repair protein rad50, partial [Linderina macrospora]